MLSVFVYLQVYRFCLNLNFKEEYRIYDDIFALLHEDVQLSARGAPKRAFSGAYTVYFYCASALT